MEEICDRKDLSELTNAEILEAIISCPLRITEAHRIQLLKSQENFHLFDELRILIRRIFDINEKALLEQSDATSGDLGILNKKSYEARIRRYNNRIKNNDFNRTVEGNKVIVAEGDSWFQFPKFIKDIIDWLTIRNPQFAIYCIAYAGDWMTNMIYDGKYIEELSIHKPDVFLISAGGNDLVGSNRIALMVDLNANSIKYNHSDAIPDLEKVDAADKIEILSVQHLINKEFYSFLLVLELQYRKIIESISDKYPSMLILAHGYDFAIPSYKRTFSFRYPIKFVVNKFVDTGKWMARPLRIKGIFKEECQRKIIKALIFELNLMLNRIHETYPNFYHVNALKVASGPKDWFDELHLKPHVFKKVAMAFEITMKEYAEGLKMQSKPEMISDQIVEKTFASKPIQKKKYVVTELIKAK